MQYLARKVQRALWDETLPVDPKDVAADAVTIDLRTSGHILSVWKCGATEDELREVALAIACTRAPCPIHLVLLDVEVLESAGIPMVNKPANTPVTSLNSRHVDLTELTLTRLVAIAHHIAGKVRSDTHCREFRRKEVLDIVAEAVQKGRVREQSLKQEWQTEIRGSGLA